MRRFFTVEYLAIFIPALLICVAAVWFTLRYVKPAPPNAFVISTSTEGGPYYDLALRFKEQIEKRGVRLDIRPSHGSVDNLQILQDDTAGVETAIVQSGLGNHVEMPQLFSMGRLLMEPVWIFYRGEQTFDRLTQLKGKRILIGPEGSGTSSLAKVLLGANGVTAQNSELIAMEVSAYESALLNDKADVGFIVNGAESKVVQTLLRQPEIKLMSMAQADALIQRYPYLSAVTLRAGVIDFTKSIPPADTTLVATKAMLLIRDDLHPALRTLLAEAVLFVQSQPALKPNGEAKLFALGVDDLTDDPAFPISDDVRRVYKSGPTFFQRVLPFWLATLFDRAFILLLPLIGVILPLARLVPLLYNWRIKRRILRWYRALKMLERDLTKNAATPDFLERKEKELDLIEHNVWELSVPDQYAPDLYTLRDHVEFVRRRILYLKQGKPMPPLQPVSSDAPIVPSVIPSAKSAEPA